LYYRINVIELRVPPLRERRDDLGGLANDIISRLARDQGRPAPRLGDDARAALMAYPFPGNVRELENILERALAMAHGDEVAADDLGLDRSDKSNVEPSHARLPHPPSSSENPESAPAALPTYIEDVERKAIEKALQESRYNKTKAAAALGITFRALRY